MKNSLWVGVLIGVFAPAFAYILTNYTSFVQQFFPTKPFVFYILAAAVNLVLVRIYYRREMPQDNIAKGVIISTFLGMLFILYFYKVHI